MNNHKEKRNEVNKDEVLTEQEIADLFEEIIMRTDNDMCIVNGLLGLLSTIKEYANSDFPPRIDDCLWEPSQVVAKFTHYYSGAIDNLIQRGTKLFKTTDYRDEEGAKTKLDADVKDFESRLGIYQADKQETDAL